MLAVQDLNDRFVQKMMIEYKAQQPNGRNKTIIALRANGFTYGQISLLLNISRCVVAGVIYRARLPTTPKP